MNVPGTVRVAAVQCAPAVLDREATLDRVHERALEAARGGAGIVAFPEAFVPGYPDWVWALAPSRKSLLHPLHARLIENAVEIPGPAVDRLGAAARDAGVFLIVGASERNAEASGLSLYNSLLFFGPDGSLLGRHRKLVSTYAERMVWAPGDASGLRTYETPWGRLGGLLCWENYMPLARYALYASGVQFYIAATWDRGEAWLATLRHLGRESGACVIGCCMSLRTRDIPESLGIRGECYPAEKDWINAGDSMIVGPEGEILAGPAHEQETILYADVDPARLLGARARFDAGGHYARPDVFELTVRSEPPPMLRRAGGRPPEATGGA